MSTLSQSGPKHPLTLSLLLRPPPSSPHLSYPHASHDLSSPRPTAIPPVFLAGSKLQGRMDVDVASSRGVDGMMGQKAGKAGVLVGIGEVRLELVGREAITTPSEYIDSDLLSSHDNHSLSTITFQGHGLPPSAACEAGEKARFVDDRGVVFWRAREGKSSFPFSFTLPTSLPSTYHPLSKQGIRASITYHLIGTITSISALARGQEVEIVIKREVVIVEDLSGSSPVNAGVRERKRPREEDHSGLGKARMPTEPGGGIRIELSNVTGSGGCFVMEGGETMVELVVVNKMERAYSGPPRLKLVRVSTLRVGLDREEIVREKISEHEYSDPQYLTPPLTTLHHHLAVRPATNYRSVRSLVESVQVDDQDAVDQHISCGFEVVVEVGCEGRHSPDFATATIPFWIVHPLSEPKLSVSDRHERISRPYLNPSTRIDATDRGSYIAPVNGNELVGSPLLSSATRPFPHTTDSGYFPPVHAIHQNNFRSPSYPLTPVQAVNRGTTTQWQHHGWSSPLPTRIPVGGHAQALTFAASRDSTRPGWKSWTLETAYDLPAQVDVADPITPAVAHETNREYSVGEIIPQKTAIVLPDVAPSPVGSFVDQARMMPIPGDQQLPATRPISEVNWTGRKALPLPPGQMTVLHGGKRPLSWCASSVHTPTPSSLGQMQDIPPLVTTITPACIHNPGHPTSCSIPSPSAQTPRTTTPLLSPRPRPISETGIDGYFSTPPGGPAIRTEARIEAQEAAGESPALGGGRTTPFQNWRKGRGGRGLPVPRVMGQRDSRSATNDDGHIGHVNKDTDEQESEDRDVVETKRMAGRERDRTEQRRSPVVERLEGLVGG